MKTSVRQSFKEVSKIISRWQNVMAVAAIIAVAVLHFVIQSSFIKSEIAKNLMVEEVSVEAEHISSKSDEIKSFGFEAQKINDETTPKPVSQPKPQQKQIVTPKTQPKKKNEVENRAERLRRAEKILTGI